MESLVIHALHVLLVLDRAFQRRIRKLVPDFEALWTDPDAYLSEQELTIGPMRHYTWSVAFSIFVGCFLCCGFIPTQGQPRPMPIPQRILLFGVCTTILLASFMLVYHLSGGGTLILRRAGVAMRLRSRSVFLPWSLLQVQGQVLDFDGNYAGVPTWPTARDYEIESRNNSVAQVGQHVRAKQFYFRRDGSAVIKNLYAARLHEVVDLLMHLGRVLGPITPLPPALLARISHQEWKRTARSGVSVCSGKHLRLRHGAVAS